MKTKIQNALRRPLVLGVLTLLPLAFAGNSALAQGRNQDHRDGNSTSHDQRSAGHERGNSNSRANDNHTASGRGNLTAPQQGRQIPNARIVPQPAGRPGNSRQGNHRGDDNRPAFGHPGNDHRGNDYRGNYRSGDNHHSNGSSFVKGAIVGGIVGGLIGGHAYHAPARPNYHNSWGRSNGWGANRYGNWRVQTYSRPRFYYWQRRDRPFWTRDIFYFDGGSSLSGDCSVRGVIVAELGSDRYEIRTDSGVFRLILQGYSGRKYYDGDVVDVFGWRNQATIWARPTDVLLRN